MLAPKRRKGQEPYANTTERTMAAERRIGRVVRGLLRLVDAYCNLGSPMVRRRRNAALRLLADTRTPYPVSDLVREQSSWRA